MTGIFTLDAIMALVIATIVLSMSIYMLAEPKKQTNEYLYQLSLDFLTVAGEKHMLQDIVGNDPSKLEELKSVMPPQMCFQLSLKNESGSLVYSDDNGCSQPVDYAIGRRTFTKDARFYVAEMKVWLR